MLTEVHLPSGKSIEDVEDLGVAIRAFGHNRRHVGLLIQVEGEGVRLCHLARHKHLRDDRNVSGYSWLQSPLSREERRNVLFFVDGIMRVNKNEGIPYAPGYSGAYFDARTYRYFRNIAGDGLTCATFIIAIFEHLKLPLLQCDTWEFRDGDAVIMQGIISDIESGSQHVAGIEDHITAIRSQPADVRYRPEEVAAGVASTDAPLDFLTAANRGEHIANSIGFLVAKPPQPTASADLPETPASS